MPPFRPLDCRTVERVIRSFGFSEAPNGTGTSHRQFEGTYADKFRKVTLDCHHGEVKALDVKSIIGQMGVSKKDFWKAVENV